MRSVSSSSSVAGCRFEAAVPVVPRFTASRCELEIAAATARLPGTGFAETIPERLSLSVPPPIDCRPRDTVVGRWWLGRLTAGAAGAGLLGKGLRVAAGLVAAGFDPGRRLFHSTTSRRKLDRLPRGSGGGSFEDERVCRFSGGASISLSCSATLFLVSGLRVTVRFGIDFGAATGARGATGRMSTGGDELISSAGATAG